MILLTNDDGIQEISLWALKERLSKIDECVIVAPATQMSASSHAISLGKDIRLSKYYDNNEFVGYQVAGTPADCVKLALTEILDEEPALVVSGINRGPNTGVSVYYSGTVSAAREGTISGIPSIAVSMCCFEFDDFSYAVELVEKIAKDLLSSGLPEGVTINVNVPPLSKGNVKGAKITTQACSRFIERYIDKGEENGEKLYQLAGELESFDRMTDNDEKVVDEGYASITPLRLDMTEHSHVETLKERFGL